jgi:hypothetical protein
MPDELAPPGAEATNPAPGVAQPPPELDIADLDPNAEPQPEGQEIAAQLDDSEEIEYEGNKYKVPKALAPAVMRQKDYTQKTQEAAAIRREAEARYQQAQEFAQAVQQDLNEHAQLHAIRQQVEQYKNVNWQQLEAEDPLGAQNHFRRYTMLKDAAGEVERAIQAKHHDRTSKAAAEQAKQREQARATLAREIPNFSPKLESDLVAYASKHGVPAENAKAAMDGDPVSIKLLHKAFLYDQLVEKQRAAKQAPPAEPVRPINGRGAVPQGLSDSLSIEAWMERRAKQAAR